MLKSTPYILITGARIPYFFHSENRMVEELRRQHPDPLVEVNPRLARERGLREGMWAQITSPRGSCRQRGRSQSGSPMG